MGQPVFFWKDGSLRVFESTNSYMNNIIRNGGNYSLNKNINHNKTITQQQKLKKMEEMSEAEKKARQEQDKEIEQLQRSYKMGVVSDDEYDRKYIEIGDRYYEKINKLKYPTIYDEKNDNFIEIEKEDIFYDKNKDYTLKAKKTNITYDENEVDALNKYTSQYGAGSYSSVNSKLYGQNVYSNDLTESKIKDLDSAMSKSKIGGNYQLYRSVEPSRINDSEIAKEIEKINRAYKKGGGKNLDKSIEKINQLKGRTIENKGFVSTSTFPDKNYSQRGVTFVIETKPNDRAIDVRNISAYAGGRNNLYAAFSKGPIQTESEVLYDRDTNFKVKDIAITDDGVYILVDTEQKKRS